MTDVRELIERLREHATDWDGRQMPDLEPAWGDPTAGTLRQAATALTAALEREEALREAIKEAVLLSGGYTTGPSWAVAAHITEPLRNALESTNGN